MVNIIVNIIILFAIAILIGFFWRGPGLRPQTTEAVQSVQMPQVGRWLGQKRVRRRASCPKERPYWDMLIDGDLMLIDGDLMVI